MIRFLLRLLGIVSLAVAFIFVIYDGMKSIADQALFLSRVGDLWNSVNGPSQDAMHAWILAHAPPWAWDPGMMQFLEAPIWLVLLILGSIFILLGRPKRPMIGYARS